ncbi:MAG: hypothetical protein ABJO36_01590 [Litorimonas sp.]
MKHLLTQIAIASAALTATGCSTLSSNPAVINAPTQLMTSSSVSQVQTAPPQDLGALHQMSQSINSDVKAVFPKGNEPNITLWAVDMENLVDGTFTQTFGDKLSPSPSLKLHTVFKDTGVTLIDHLHVPVCQGADTGNGQYWVLRTYISDLDESVERSVKGIYPNGESGDFQVEVDRGNRKTTDSFKLSSKLTECRSGRIIHSAESSFSKTTSSKDRSVYLFGKYLGVFYRSTEYLDPGLNRTKDIALDVFLTSIVREMVGVPAPDVTLDKASAKDVAKL